jgi:Domain of unknown function (DUF4304)
MPLKPEHEAAVRQLAAWKHRQRDKTIRSDGRPSPQDVYADMMKTTFAPALRAAGLRGSNGRFELPSDIYWAQLGFQKSSYSGADEVRYTVNLSVISRTEREMQRAAKPYLGRQPKPTVHYGPWADQVRIGQLTDNGADKWWRIVRGADVEPVRADTLADLLTYAVPWLKARVTR